MKNLSDDELRDIDDLVSNLAPDENSDPPVDEEVPENGSNGEAVSVETPALQESPSIDENPLNPTVLTVDLFKLISLQNDRLGILNKKIDVLTRLVELILRANLEEVE
ncbi:hypothetical protein E3V33_02350 [Candidatus Marinimicrobia bacterium MT.SAG.4]|nr:hypothetical protein E3V33_02350 [Candidatus Marinimicrobia bacterium MT.SAG.4]